MKRSKPIGQSFTEYSLIGASMLLVAVAGILLLGQNVNITFRDMLGGYHPKGTVQVAAGASTNPSQSMTGGNGSIAANSPGGSSSLNTISLNNGDLQTALQVAGANGVTTILADRITALSQQLLAQGEITPEQANLFSDLANQGHRIAGIEKLIEDASRNNQTSIEFEGQSYTPIQLTGKLGWSGVGIGSPILQSIDDVESVDAASRSVELTALLNKYQALQDSGALQNPTVQKFVGSMTSQIGSISETLESIVSNTSWDPTPVQTNVASSLSNIDSVQICTSGNGSDRGIHCQ
jgi:hypothetical protein